MHGLSGGIWHCDYSLHIRQAYPNSKSHEECFIAYHVLYYFDLWHLAKAPEKPQFNPIIGEAALDYAFLWYVLIVLLLI